MQSTKLVAKPVAWPVPLQIQTKRALTLSRPLFEAAFAAEGGYARADILKPAGQDDWDLIEVKSTTSAKAVHLDDLAFQAWVRTRAGVRLRRVALLHINPDFVRQGSVDPHHFFSLVDLPYSDAPFVMACERECTETFREGHVQGFEFFEGVPWRITYDNTKVAVSQIVGQERRLTQGFLQLKSHYLFDAHFCRVARGNEKGVVEGLVKFTRLNFLVPVPQVPDLAQLNAYLRGGYAGCKDFGGDTCHRRATAKFYGPCRRDRDVYRGRDWHRPAAIPVVRRPQR